MTLAYVVENLRKKWYTGEEHISVCDTNMLCLRTARVTEKGFLWKMSLTRSRSAMEQRSNASLQANSDYDSAYNM